MMLTPPPEFEHKKYPNQWREDHQNASPKDDNTISLHAYAPYSPTAPGVIHIYPIHGYKLDKRASGAIYNVTPEWAEAFALELIYAAKIARGEIPE